MNRRRWWLRALVAFLLTAHAACTPAPSANAPAAALARVPDLKPGEPRAVVARVADLIEANYVHETKARKIAAELRKDAGRGAFDRDANPRDLATALSDRLKHEDGHFHVGWAPDTPETKREPVALTPMLDEVRAKRFNHWFRRIEILPGNVGYIHLSEFADLTPDAASPPPAQRTADAALAFLGNTDAVIFDLRDNGGGGGMVEYLLSHYLPPDLVLGVMRGRTKSTETRTLAHAAGPRGRRLDVPLYVLISGRTASAAEFFAYSLQMQGRATILGETSAGVANPYEEFDVGHGFRIAISIDEPIDARSGKSWDGVGVKPDVPVAARDALTRARVLALSGLLRRPMDAASARDARWALDALRPEAKVPGPLGAYVGSYGIRSIRIDAGTLVLERATWPLRVLRFLGDDTFWIEGEPWARVVFERDARGDIVAMSQLDSSGGVQRFPKVAPRGDAPR